MLKIRRIFDAFEYSTNLFWKNIFWEKNSSNIRRLFFGRIFDESHFSQNIFPKKRWLIRIFESVKFVEYVQNHSNIFDFRIRRIFWKIRRIFAIVGPVSLFFKHFVFETKRVTILACPIFVCIVYFCCL